MDRKISSSKKSCSASKPSDSNCVICFEMRSIFSVGSCDHPICYECSTSIRVLLNQKECPICRCVMTKVIFTKELDLFKNLDRRQYSHYNKKYGIAFGDYSVECSFKELMRIYCKKCSDQPQFEEFGDLIDHMRIKHKLHFCCHCESNLKIFPSQRRWYNLPELARHMKSGDPDNTSLKGHPVCYFCRSSYFDKDELYRHLRDEHYSCHFCDADGIECYYMTYEYLLRHYQNDHYSCEDCVGPFQPLREVFYTEIELQAHRAQYHSRNLEHHHGLSINHGSMGCSYACMLMRNNATRTNSLDVSEFPSLNQNQPVNLQNLNSFSTLGQELVPQPNPPNSNNNQWAAAAAVPKKLVEPPKPDKNGNAIVGPSTSQLVNQVTVFQSSNGNQQTQAKGIDTSATSSSNSSSSGVSNVKTANVNGQDNKKKGKKDVASIKRKITKSLKVPGSSDFINLNKKMEASVSSLTKLDNQKKTANSKKNGPVENNNNNQNKKKNNVQTTVENNNLQKAIDSNKFDNNIENNKPKLILAEVQCNSTANGSDEAKAMMTIALNNSVESSTEPKEDTHKKKENGFVPLLEKLEETVMDTNNQKDEKKSEDDDNGENSLSTENYAMTISCPQLQQENDIKPLRATPKIPPGFEKSSQNIRASPGLSIDGNLLQTQIEAPPSLSLTNNDNKNKTKLPEYLHSIDSTVLNPVMINNLMAASIPVQDECYDTFDKLNDKSKLKLAEVQCKNTANDCDIVTAIMNIARKTKINVTDNCVKSSTEPKEGIQKKENGFVPLLEKLEETVMDTNNQKDKKKSEDDENNENSLSAANYAITISCPQLQQENDSKPLQATPKIPPGFEKSFQNYIRASPGLLIDGNRLQTQIEAPPSLSITNNNDNETKLPEYLQPIDSTVWNPVMTNNLMVASKPVQDEHHDTFEKLNDKPKLMLAEVQCNGTANGSDIATAIMNIASKTNLNAMNTSVKSSTEPKIDLDKKKENGFVSLLKKPEESLVDTNIQKDKKKSEDNENSKNSLSVANFAMTMSCPRFQQENDSKPLQATPKIPPGFEKSFQHNIKASSELLVDGNGLQTQIKVPPGLSLTNNNYKNTFESFKLRYKYPADWTIRNAVLVNNLSGVVIPECDELFNTPEKFSKIYTLFLNNIISAYDFYSCCVKALYPRSFKSIFQELVLLLPDIQKQQELLFIFNQICRNETNVKKCQYCQQVLGASEIEHHIMSFHNK